MHRYWLVAIGGGFGTLARFGLSEWIAGLRFWPPLAILVVNVSGCFAISFLNFVSDPSGNIYLGPRSRAFLMTGFCGGYTTFSSFSLLSFYAVQRGQFLEMWLNITLSHVLCLFGIWLGYLVAAPFPNLLFKFQSLLKS
ncbi:MAG: fluoride efflux transporter CrcB [Verrucomicrobia bacterium]|nr:fluoride efflux transporter CrcB [Verrucomicrobiota bacterium]